MAEKMTDDEKAAFQALNRKINKAQQKDKRLDAYYEGIQRLQHMGLAVPDALRRFETVINVPRMAVDEVQRRLDVRFLIAPGQETDSPELRTIWNQNNLDSQIPLVLMDALIYGRGYMSVSADAERGVRIAAEHAPDMAVTRDTRTGGISSALRVYEDERGKKNAATLYLPGLIVLLDKGPSGWEVTERRPHSLGVPVVAFVNRPRTGTAHKDGVSEMADVIGLTDAIARTITNMQVALETHAVPQKYVMGASKGDFVDAKTGQPLTVWESYFSGVWTVKDPNAKAGTFTSASMANFTDSVNNMLAWCASILGLPTRYAGQQTVNPAAEGAIRADEARLVKNCERKAVMWGDVIGELMGMAASIATGRPMDGSLIKVTWNDPGTPTMAQKADALQKLSGGTAILSREGVWDELGWSEERKARERSYFEDELHDPTLDLLQAKVTADYGDAA